jgi:hypothetical protein
MKEILKMVSLMELDSIERKIIYIKANLFQGKNMEKEN